MIWFAHHVCGQDHQQSQLQHLCLDPTSDSLQTRSSWTSSISGTLQVTITQSLESLTSAPICIKHVFWSPGFLKRSLGSSFEHGLNLLVFLWSAGWMLMAASEEPLRSISTLQEPLRTMCHQRHTIEWAWWNATMPPCDPLRNASSMHMASLALSRCSKP